MNFFRKEAAQPFSLNLEKEFNQHRELYALFCKSPLQTYEKSWDEFRWLCEMPEIEKIAFQYNHTGNLILVIGTSDIYLRMEYVGRWYHIGQFACVFQRMPEVSMRIYNCTHQAPSRLHYGSMTHHPHVNNDGFLCSSNRQIIMEDVSVGRIKKAMTKLLVALNTFGPNLPYSALEDWPLASAEAHKQLEGEFNARHSTS